MRTRYGGWTAVALAWLFAVHVVLAALGTAAASPGPPLDRFGNVLCHTPPAAGTGDPAGHGGTPPPLATCCSLGCLLAGGALEPPVLFTLAAATPVATPAPRFTVRAEAAAGVPDTPRRTRGPPARG